MTDVLERRLEDVKRGYALGDFSIEEFEAEVEAILSNPHESESPFAAFDVEVGVWVFR